MPAAGRLHYRRAFLCVGVALLLLLSASTAGAAAPTTRSLAVLPHAAQKLTAYGGYVVFSQYEPAAQEWHLMAWHGGSITPLAVPARRVPFDANAGPAASGRPAVVYSRCAHEPSEHSPGGWALARGCRIYELALPGGSPALVNAIGAPGASDSTPAIWNGDIAFGRISGRSHSARIYLWRHSDDRLVRLGAGPGPTCLPGKPPTHGTSPPQLPPGLPVPGDVDQGPCETNAGGHVSAWAAGMSLGSAALAFEWFSESKLPAFGEGSEPQIRIDPLRGGRQSAAGRVAETSFVSGTCGAVGGSSPSADGNGVLYRRSDYAICAPGGQTTFTSFVSYNPEFNAWRTAHAPGGLIAAVAQDGSTTYWISDVPAQRPLGAGGRGCGVSTSANFVCDPTAEGIASDCDPKDGACTLMRTTGLSFGAPEHHPPRGPA
jgi:hypothetical protein